jgi:WD40 repeat protein
MAVAFVFFVLICSSYVNANDELGKIIFSRGGGINIFDVNNGTETVIYKDEITDFSRSFAWNLATKEIVTQSRAAYPISGVGEIKIFNAPACDEYTNIAVNLDGKIAMTRSGKKSSKLYYSLDGLNFYCFTDFEVINSWWSPTDSNLILVNSKDNRYYLYNVAKKELTIILKNAFHTEWAKDGREIYYDDNKNIYMYNLETRKSEKITTGTEARPSEDDKYISLTSNANAYVYDKEAKNRIFLFPKIVDRRTNYRFLGWDKNQVIYMKVYPENNPELYDPKGCDYRKSYGDIITVDPETGIKEIVATIKDFYPGNKFLYIPSRDVK